MSIQSQETSSSTVGSLLKMNIESDTKHDLASLNTSFDDQENSISSSYSTSSSRSSNITSSSSAHSSPHSNFSRNSCGFTDSDNTTVSEVVNSPTLNSVLAHNIPNSVHDKKPFSLSQDPMSTFAPSTQFDSPLRLKKSVHVADTMHALQLQLLSSLSASLQYQINQLVSRTNDNVGILKADLEKVYENIENQAQLASNTILPTSELTATSTSSHSLFPSAESPNKSNDTTCLGVNSNCGNQDTTPTKDSQTTSANSELIQEQKNLDLIFSEFEQKISTTEDSLKDIFKEIRQKVSDANRILAYSESQSSTKSFNSLPGPKVDNLNLPSTPTTPSTAGFTEIPQPESSEHTKDAQKSNATSVAHKEERGHKAAADFDAKKISAPLETPEQLSTSQLSKNDDTDHKQTTLNDKSPVETDHFAKVSGNTKSTHTKKSDKQAASTPAGTKIPSVNKPWWTDELSYLKQESMLARGLVKMFGDEASILRAKTSINKYHRTMKVRRNMFCAEMEKQVVKSDERGIIASSETSAELPKMFVPNDAAVPTTTAKYNSKFNNNHKGLSLGHKNPEFQNTANIPSYKKEYKTGNMNFIPANGNGVMGFRTRNKNMNSMDPFTNGGFNQLVSLKHIHQINARISQLTQQLNGSYGDPYFQPQFSYVNHVNQYYPEDTILNAENMSLQPPHQYVKNPNYRNGNGKNRYNQDGYKTRPKYMLPSGNESYPQQQFHFDKYNKMQKPKQSNTDRMNGGFTTNSNGYNKRNQYYNSQNYERKYQPKDVSNEFKVKPNPKTIKLEKSK